jgi:Aph-1 protein
MSATLILGCFFLAFGPLLSLFACVVYPKAQLVILVTTFALVFILSATAASVVYFLLHAIFQFETPSDSTENGLESTFRWTDGAVAAMLPSVLFQFLGRCLGTSLYHSVERVIAASLQQHQEEERLKNGGNVTSNTTSDAALLKLALNDGASGVAAAVGFGGMHAILLYGTLLSSEAVNNSAGILYQDSCPNIPSLVHSALLTNLVSILQVFWMLLTFFGMRRRVLFHRGEHAMSERPSRRALWSDSRTGGNYALLYTLLSHLFVAGITLFNRQPNGCRITLPVVGGMVLVTAYVFFIGCARIYMPPPLIPEMAAGDVASE